MSTRDEDTGGLGGDDAVAAEYVLGVLDAAERVTVARRVETEPAFARLVDAWEARLAPLGESYAAETPPASLKAAIDRRLFASATSAAEAARLGLLSTLAFWRGLSAAAIAALALVALLPALRPAPPPVAEGPRLVAALSGDASDVRFVAVYGEDRTVALSRLSGAVPEGRDFELWLIEGQQAPRSLGVLPRGETLRIDLPADIVESIAKGAVFAISVEPPGGSTTGAPTGPVVATGALHDI